MAEENKLYTQRLLAISKIRQMADEQGDEAMLKKADELEDQAAKVYADRTAKLSSAEDKASLERGRDSLTSYRFGSGAANHLFCARCGVKSFYQPRSHPDSWSINAHCLDQQVELAIERFDGRDWERAAERLDHRHSAD